MKMMNPLISFISSILFLEEYNFSEEKLKKIKKRFPYIFAIWILFILTFLFGLHGNHSFVKRIPENIGIQLELLFFLLFSIYHWFLMICISKFATKHIAYLVLFIPMTIILIWNLVYWNKPTYFGAMDGFASIMDFYMQSLILIILPTFLFALRMVKIRIKFKAISLMITTTISAFLGVEQCIGKEGYLADGTGGVFVFLIILLSIVTLLLLKTIKLKNV